jgi:hypothetical protein
MEEVVLFQTDIKEKDLMNFKLYHNYHSVSGIATLIFGIICLVICVVSYGSYNIAYTVMVAFFGLFFTVYTPIGMKLKVRKQMKKAQSFSEPVKYTVTEEKITLSQGEVSENLNWDEIFKMKATGSSIILYISAVRANIIPYRCLGDSAEGFIEIAEKKLTPFQVKLNKNKVIAKCHEAVQNNG